MEGLARSRTVPPFLIVAICFLSQNCAMGLAFGSYGVLLASTENHFGISRALAATGISMLSLAMGLFSPVAGMLIQRIPVRIAMLAAAALSAIGYGTLAFTQSFTVALAMYALVGIGVIVLAILGPVTLISRWFPSNRPKMLGIVNQPLVLFLAPFLVAEALIAFGRITVFVGMGLTFVILMPLLLLLTERPTAQEVRKTSTPASPAAHKAAHPTTGPTSILRSPAFWLLSLAVGILSGSGSAFMVHFIPFAMSKALSLQMASSALSAYSGAGFFGILFFSWLAGRIGPALALGTSAIIQATIWLSLLYFGGPSLLVLAGLLGFCTNAVVTLHGATLGDIFGTERVGTAMGYSYMAKLPFLFGFAPAFGAAYDGLGNYSAAFYTTALMLAGSGLSAYILWTTIREKKLVPALGS